MEDSSLNARFVVTLVHGTWAGKREWTKEDSSVLCSQLKDELRSRGGVRFTEPLVWTGDNNHKDRLDASERLSELLRTSCEGAKQIPVIIAHSHGGNIALKAVGSSPDLPCKTLIVALATPFLRFERRPAGLLLMPTLANNLGLKLKSPLSRIFKKLAEHLAVLASGLHEARLSEGSPLIRVTKVLLLLLMGLGILTGIVLVARYFEYPYIIRPIEAAPGMLATFVCTRALAQQTCDRLGFAWLEYTALLMTIGLGGGFTIVSLLEAKSAVRVDVARQQDRAIATYGYFERPERLQGLRLLVMSSWIDEALGALAGAWSLHRAMLWVARLISIASLAAVFLGVGAVVFFVVKYVLEVAWGQQTTEAAIVVAFVLGLVSVSFVARLSQAISWGVWRLATAMGLGLADRDIGLSVSVKASRRPPAFLNACVYPPYRFLALRWKSRGFLTHSLLYNHRPAIHVIANWLVEVSEQGVSR
jgi:hypothetical protein